jgi:hypothetical protein
VLSGLYKIDAMSFRFAYSSCGWCKKACEYVTNENLMEFQMVGQTRTSPNGFGASGSDAPPPPPNMTIQEQFMVTQS